ncbi:hypothetical protein Tco_0368093 [Tanacetum coccineum]
MDEFLAKLTLFGKAERNSCLSGNPQKITPLFKAVKDDLKLQHYLLIKSRHLVIEERKFRSRRSFFHFHKFLAIVFNDDDIEERTSRWDNKCIKKFNPYARYGVENWKNPHVKIFYIRRQKEPGRPKEEIYSNSKIV